MVLVRLTPDARRLEVFLPPTAMHLPRAALLSQVLEQCASLHIRAALTAGELEELLRSCVYGSWIPVLTATPPTPPTDGRADLLIDVPVQSSGQRAQRRYQTVRAGNPLARLLEGAPGAPGHDLLGREIPPRPPRPPRPPQGENTRLSADGAELLAACDGQVVLRNMQLHIVPMHMHDGDLDGQGAVLNSQTGVVVAGSVGAGAHIDAQGDVLIEGHVREARILSANGRITVRGSVSGSIEQPSVLHAGLDITCRSLLHAELHAGGDIVVQSEAHNSRLEASGHVYVQDSIERSLFDVELRIGGGVVPLVDPLAPPVSLPIVWEQDRAAMSLEAVIALHGAPPKRFYRCIIEQLTATGARCRLSAPLPGGEQARGTLLQLKVELPGGQEQVLIIARVERVIDPLVLKVEFLQVTHPDTERLSMLGLELMRARRTAG